MSLYSNNMLERFIKESNDIEREGTCMHREKPVYEWFLANDLNEENTLEFHKHIATKRKQLQPSERGVYRTCPVWIGGTECSAYNLEKTMKDFWKLFENFDAFDNHKFFELIHPFVDLNGRTGRAIWLHQMLQHQDVPLGFLHTWYYQTLSHARR